MKLLSCLCEAPVNQPNITPEVGKAASQSASPLQCLCHEHFGIGHALQDGAIVGQDILLCLVLAAGEGGSMVKYYCVSLL